ncbi:MAG TPA: hypothetical protein VMT93_09370 [Gemmatimonadaceae bacterium]|nr:hypothetical protein [Gemmatimonadaceae bacterium]
MRVATRLALLLCALLAAAAAAQKTKEPKRPNVGDKNDPDAYYRWGVSQMQTYPEDAADAFYWATRLDPGNADAFYARWVALYLADPDLLVLHWQNDSKAMSSKDVLRIDSLQLRALELNPFLYRRYERVMWQHVIEQVVKRGDPTVDQAELMDAVREYTSKGDAATQAVIAYSQANFPRALEEWATAMTGFKYKAGVHAERGRIFYLLAGYDSAAAEFQAATAEERSADKNYLIAVYDSKAVNEQSLGIIRERQGASDAAREAYGRALQEDLSYAPAHMALANLDLAKADTAGALSEMDIASQVAPNDGWVAFFYGKTLLFAGHDAESLEQLKRAVKLEPYWAEPHVFMAAIYDNANYTAEAMAEYRTFLDLAPQRDNRVARVKARLAKMSADSAAKANPGAAPAAAPPSPPAP